MGKEKSTSKKNNPHSTPDEPKEFIPEQVLDVETQPPSQESPSPVKASWMSKVLLGLFLTSLLAGAGVAWTFGYTAVSIAILSVCVLLPAALLAFPLPMKPSAQETLDAPETPTRPEAASMKKLSKLLDGPAHGVDMSKELNSELASATIQQDASEGELESEKEESVADSAAEEPSEAEEDPYDNLYGKGFNSELRPATEEEFRRLPTKASRQKFTEHEEILKRRLFKNT